MQNNYKDAAQNALRELEAKLSEMTAQGTLHTGKICLQEGVPHCSRNYESRKKTSQNQRLSCSARQYRERPIIPFISRIHRTLPLQQCRMDYVFKTSQGTFLCIQRASHSQVNESYRPKSLLMEEILYPNIRKI